MFYVAFRCVVVASSFRTERYNITGALISDAIMTQRKASGLRMDQSELDYELFYLSEIYLFHTDGLSLDGFLFPCQRIELLVLLLQLNLQQVEYPDSLWFRRRLPVEEDAGVGDVVLSFN